MCPCVYAGSGCNWQKSTEINWEKKNPHGIFNNEVRARRKGTKIGNSASPLSLMDPKSFSYTPANSQLACIFLSPNRTLCKSPPFASSRHLIAQVMWMLSGSIRHVGREVLQPAPWDQSIPMGQPCKQGQTVGPGTCYVAWIRKKAKFLL